MFKKILLLILFTLSFSLQAANKEGQVRYNASTGDTKLDLSLGKLNLKADGNINDFIKALGYEYQVPTTKIEKLILDYNFSASDAYMTVSIGNLTGHSIDEVSEFYRNNKSKGWGFVARQMGVKPGSKEFHQLKRGSDSFFDSEIQHKSKANKQKYKTNNAGKGHPNGKNKHRD